MVGFLGTYGDIRGKVKYVMNMGLFVFQHPVQERCVF